jgi:hypothetical protein
LEALLLAWLPSQRLQPSKKMTQRSLSQLIEVTPGMLGLRQRSNQDTDFALEHIGSFDVGQNETAN